MSHDVCLRLCRECGRIDSSLPGCRPSVMGVNIRGESAQHRASCLTSPVRDGLDGLDLDGLPAALAARDISTIYRLLQRAGVSQRQIARLTGQSQSEVCEILKGRQVRDVGVLERIADGLGVSRARIGVSFGQEGPETLSVQEVDEEMKRRAVLAATAAAACNQSVLGPPIEMPLGPLPARLGISHVHAVRAAHERLVGLGRYYGGQATLVGAAAKAYTPWLQLPGPEPIKAQLAAALADLHTEAGWCCYDEGVDGAGYFLRALGLAKQAADAHSIAYAAWNAGMTLVRSGHPNDALKLFQLGQLPLGTSWRGKAVLRTDDPRLLSLLARLRRMSASAYAVMGGSDEADRYLAASYHGWEPRDAFERAGADLTAGGIHRDLGRLDAAEQFAARAVRSYGENHRRGRTLAKLLLAEVQVRAGEPQGLTLARHALNEVSTLQSLAIRRQRLILLAIALEARPGSDTRELARMARKLTTTPV